MILSVEDQLALIEKQYLKTFDRLHNSHYYDSTEYKKPNYINETIKSALTFQRSVELLFDDVKKLSDDKTKNRKISEVNELQRNSIQQRIEAGLVTSLVAK